MYLLYASKEVLNLIINFVIVIVYSIITCNIIIWLYIMELVMPCILLCTLRSLCYVRIYTHYSRICISIDISSV